MLLEAAGCILSHPMLAALSAELKPSHLQEPAPPLDAVLVQIPNAALLLALRTVQIRGFFFPKQRFLSSDASC